MASYVAPENRTKVISIRMPIGLRQEIEARAAAENKSINVFALEALKRGLAQ